jgi:hypothetical protein
MADLAASSPTSPGSRPVWRIPCFKIITRSGSTPKSPSSPRTRSDSLARTISRCSVPARGDLPRLASLTAVSIWAVSRSEGRRSTPDHELPTPCSADSRPGSPLHEQRPKNACSKRPLTKRVIGEPFWGSLQRFYQGLGGAGGGSRTHMGSRPPGPKPGASAVPPRPQG